MGLRLASRPAERGLSLIEVALALGIISIALVPTTQMWLGLSKANQAILEKAQALVVSQQILEARVRAVPYSELQPEAGEDTASGLSYALTLSELSATLKRAEVTVTRPSSPEVLIRMVTLAAKEQAP